MRSIERRFILEQESNPLSSTFINFVKSVKGQGFSRDKMSRWFNKLVDKDDYEKNERKMLLDWLETT